MTTRKANLEMLMAPRPAWRVIAGGLLLLLALGPMSPLWSQEQPEDGEIERLIDILENWEHPGEAKEAAMRLAQFGPLAAPAIPALIETLRPEAGEATDYAEAALGQIGVAAVEPLIRFIETDDSAPARINAIEALLIMGPVARDAVPALVTALNDGYLGVSEAAHTALTELGEIAVPALQDALFDRATKRRLEAAVILGNIKDASAATHLVRALNDREKTVREAAAEALGKIGSSDTVVVSGLVAVLDNGSETPEVRAAAAEALGHIKPEASEVVPSLVAALESGEDQICASAAGALGKYERMPEQIVQPLINALGELSHRELLGMTLLNECAIPIFDALGNFGADALAAVPILARLGVLDRNAFVPSLTPEIEQALVKIVVDIEGQSRELSTQELQSAISVLQEAQHTLQALTPQELVGALMLLDTTVENRRMRDIEAVFQWFGSHKTVAGVVAYIIGVPALCFLILWLRPLWILRINDLVKPFADVKLPAWAGGIKVPVSTVLLVGIFHYHPRVLDAWVAAHAATARRRFELKDTVANREVHIGVPVVVDGETVPDFSSGTLRPIFDRRLSCTLIQGEGGSGKTSLACQIARWAMSEAPEERPTDHIMLPILIEHELDFAVDSGADPLTEAIGRQLQDLIESPSPVRPDLLDRLLRQQRVLVIVDHLSEMSEATHAKIRPGAPNFPANALIVTSRLNEELGGVVRSLIEPLRVAGNRLSSFMEAYLVKRKKRHLLDDQAFFDGCRALSAMVGRRRITVLLAKLYAEQMIALAEEFGDAAQPQSIPDLMLKYLNRVNRGITENRLDDRVVHADAKRIAWMCLERRFRPGDALVDGVHQALGGPDAQARLSYLETRLHLVQVLQPAQDRIRIVLDPMAEYLAGLHLVETLGSAAEEWRDFLDRLRQAPGAPEAIRGFVLAVLDCCRAYDGESGIPDFVEPALVSLADGGDPPGEVSTGHREAVAPAARLVAADD